MPLDFLVQLIVWSGEGTMLTHVYCPSTFRFFLKLLKSSLRKSGQIRYPASAIDRTHSESGWFGVEKIQKLRIKVFHFDLKITRFFCRGKQFKTERIARMISNMNCKIKCALIHGSHVTCFMNLGFFMGDLFGRKKNKRLRSNNEK